MELLMDVLLFLLLWLALGSLVAFWVGQAIRHGNDVDAPAHVSADDWRRVATRRM